MARVWTGMFAAMALVAVVGCQNKVYDENQALRKQNQELQSQLDANRSHPESAPPIVHQEPPPQSPTVAQHNAEAADTESPAPSEPAPRHRPDLGNLKVTEDRNAGTTTVHLPSDLFFDSGQATLRESAKKSLDKVAAALKKDYAGKKVRIEGYTDSDPIVHSKWKSNQELSEKRAQAVREYLVSKGVSSSRVTTVGYGEKKPVSQNKAQNRRVEVVVLTRGS